MKSSSSTGVWFPAKRYGWGWGLPVAWQGWVVLVSYFVLLLASALVFLPDQRVVPFLAATTVLSLLLVAVSWLKGESPRWQWGGKGS